MVIDYDLAENTLAYVFDGPMDDERINELRKQIEHKLQYHKTINLYLEDRGIEYFTLYSVLMGIVFPLRHTKRFDKIAMVTDRNWIHLLSTMNSFFVSAEVRNFNTEGRVQAMNWIANE
jgi:hypothetical protein